MALSILQPGCQPLGQFDFLDTQLLSVKGGEFGVFTYTTANEFLAGADKAASDVFQDSYADGYRAVVQLANSGSATATKFYLLDDGQSTLVTGSVTTSGYGTLLGQVLGAPVGLTFTGANLGPHTAAASGKVTMWDKPGLYAVTVDNVNAGLANANTSLALPGAALYRDANGLLTLLAGAAASSEGSVGTFIEFSTNGSLVTTPAKLVGATQVYDRVVFQYNGR